MPTSFYGQISTIMDIIQEVNPKTILDIGVGFGKYGVLCRELFDIPFERFYKDTWQIRIDGVEGYKGYNNPIHTYVYNNIYYSTIEEVLNNLEINYDLALMIDILEHFEKKGGEEIILNVLKICRKLIISIPAVPYPQNYLDNALEQHKSRWEVNDFIKYNVVKSGFVPMGKNNANIIVLLQGN